MQAVYFGGSGITGLDDPPSAEVEVEAVATPIQWLKVGFVIGFPSTETSALPGIPPHADRPTAANKTAQSAGMKRTALVTTRAL